MAEDEELVAMKANLYEERACRKEGEENLVASKANAADQHRHGDKAVLKAGEMEEKVEMLMSEVEAMRGSVEAKRAELNASKRSKLATQRMLDQELFAQVPLPPSPTPQKPDTRMGHQRHCQCRRLCNPRHPRPGRLRPRHSRSRARRTHLHHLTPYIFRHL